MGKVREFMELKQREMTGAEYTVKFDGLARFAPSVVPSDDARRMRFMQGLNVDVVKQVDSGESSPRSYSDAVQRTLRIDGRDEKVEKSQIAKMYTKENNRAVVPFQGSKRQFQKNKRRFQKFNSFKERSRKQFFGKPKIRKRGTT